MSKKQIICKEGKFTYENVWRCVKDAADQVGIDIYKVCIALEKAYPDVIPTYYLSLNTKDTQPKREVVYRCLISDVSSELNDVIIDDYIKYMERLHPDDRFAYITKLTTLKKEKLLNHFMEMYVNKISDLGKELEEKFADEMKDSKRDHSDLYDFRTNYKSMIILTLAFLKKIRLLPKEKRNVYYISHTGVNVKELQDEGVDPTTIKSRLLVGLINKRASFKDEKVNKYYIDWLFNGDVGFDDSKCLCKNESFFWVFSHYKGKGKNGKETVLHNKLFDDREDADKFAKSFKDTNLKNNFVTEQKDVTSPYMVVIYDNKGKYDHVEFWQRMKPGWRTSTLKDIPKGFLVEQGFVNSINTTTGEFANIKRVDPIAYQKK